MLQMRYDRVILLKIWINIKLILASSLMTSYLNWKRPKILCLGIFWNKMILGVTPKRNLLKNLNDSGFFWLLSIVLQKEIYSKNLSNDSVLFGSMHCAIYFLRKITLRNVIKFARPWQEIWLISLNIKKWNLINRPHSLQIWTHHPQK